MSTAVTDYFTGSADVVADRVVSGSHLTLVSGGSGSGRTYLLERAAERLRQAGKSVVLIAPPGRQVDTSSLALIDCGVGLATAELLSGDLDGWNDQAGWQERSDQVRSWLRAPQLSRDGDVVLLCDDPRQWQIPGSTDLIAKAEATANLLLREAQCAKVVVGRPGDVPFDAHVEIAGGDVVRRLLADEGFWGELWPVAVSLRADLSPIAAKPPAHVGLAVAYAALASTDDLRSWWTQGTGTERLADRLASTVAADRRMRALWNFWLRASLPRRAIPRTWLAEAIELVPDGIHRQVIESCLMVGAADVRLVSEARLAAWRQDEDDFARRVRHTSASQFLDRYADAFEEARKESRPAAFLYSAEALYMAGKVGGTEAIDRVAPNFSDQLDAIGAAAVDRSEWTTARAAFEGALEWDSDDAFAHHHLGYSLDAAGVEPRRIESEYHRALELDPSQVSWHERLISYLIVRARDDEARDAWQEARAALSADDGLAAIELYERLHLPVAANLLRRAELAFARDVLDDIPVAARPRLLSYAAQMDRLKALEAAEDIGAFVPAPRARSEWWLARPQLLGERVPDGRSLRVWIAGRIANMDDETVHLAAAIVDGPRRPLTGTTTLDRDEFARLSADTERLGSLRLGQFVEFGYYGPADDEIVVIRVIPDEPWIAGLTTPLDPDRFIRRARWT